MWDLSFSISVITAFVRQYEQEKIKKHNSKIQTENNEKNDIQMIVEDNKKAGVKYSDGISLLEALSATGLRSIRYAKEIPGVKEIIANDISARAVDDIKHNVIYNGVENLVVPSQNDAV